METTLLLAFAGLWVGLVKGGVAGPLGGPLLLFVLTHRFTVQEVVGISLPLLIFGDIFAMRAYWGKWDQHHIRLLLPSAILGIVFGTYLLANLPDDVLRRIVGLFILIIIAYKLFNDALKNMTYEHRNWHGYVGGWLSGVASALANVGGPPITAYMLLQKVPPLAFVGTNTLFFFVVNLIKVPGFLMADIINIELLISIAWSLPLIPSGVWIGRRVIGWINPRLFDAAMIVLLTLAGLTLLFGSS